jgi:hypothetical protein
MATVAWGKMNSSGLSSIICHFLNGHYWSLINKAFCKRPSCLTLAVSLCTQNRPIISLEKEVPHNSSYVTRYKHIPAILKVNKLFKRLIFTVDAQNVSLLHLQRDSVDCNAPIWLKFYSTAVDPPLTSWPKYEVSTLNSFFVIHNFILQLLHYELISLTKALFDMFFVVGQLVAHWSIVRATRVHFLLILFKSPCL